MPHAKVGRLLSVEEHESTRPRRTAVLMGAHGHWACASAHLFRANHLGDTIFMKDTETKTLPKNGPQPTARRGAPQLRILYSPSYQGRSIFSLLKGVTEIGRTEGEGKIAFPSDSGMSKLHASIKVTDSSGNVFLRDHSKNGTTVGEIQLSKNENFHPIEDGDVIRLGNTIAMMRYEPVKPDDAKIPSLIGVSLVMKDLRARIARVAEEDSVSILLRGETGTGKEVVARAIHQLSKRQAGPFVAVNCAAVPETLAEAEFFGNTKSAFTGAIARKGCFRAAAGGSLFLDEIGDMSVSLQPRLFRAISEKEITPLGCEEPVLIDYRLIAATNQPLWNDGSSSNFRKELFGRIAQFQIHIPPLRDRREDIVPLLLHFYPESGNLLDADFVHALLRYDWPLNVRQLFNISQQLRIDRSSVNVVKLLRELDEDSDDDLDDAMVVRDADKAKRNSAERSTGGDSRPHVVPSKEQLHSYMTSHQGNISRVAQSLCCDRRSVRRYLVLHKLCAESYRPPSGSSSAASSP